MARVDYQEAFHRLRSELKAREEAGKSSWGARELRLFLADLEVDCAVTESPTDTIFRLFGAELEELFFDRLPRPEGATQTPDEQDHAHGREPQARTREMTGESTDREAEGPERSDAPWQPPAAPVAPPPTRTTTRSRVPAAR